MNRLETRQTHNAWKAGAAALCLLVVLLLLAVFEVRNAHHACTGEDCPICEVLAVCEQFYSQFEVVVKAAAAVVAAVFATAVIRHFAMPVFVTVQKNLLVRRNC